MSAISGKTIKAHAKHSNKAQSEKPTREEAESAVRTLISWAGDDPTREGLLDTPQRVTNAYQEFFSGYHECPLDCLSRTFDAIKGYDDIVLLRDIDFHSHCEHHMVPFIGKVHVAYYPNKRIIGISKLVRTIEIFARRLQTQEAMSSQIAHAIDSSLQPDGVAVMIDAVHQCMSMRGVKKRNISTVTAQFLGKFKDMQEQKRFISLVCP
ncbi:MAG: GTP cyclohydrolase I FolE [Alphaproteobacteria bacterium]|nr:GTP cyclohydrolase I FolE [Alphaproteobacteria bacterium]